MGKLRPPVLLPLPISLGIVLLFLIAAGGPFAASAAAVFEEGGLGGLEEILGSGRIRGLLGRSVLLAKVTIIAIYG